MPTNPEKTVKTIINKVYPTSDKAFQPILRLLNYQSLEKGSIFIHRDRPNNYEYFILSGICRSYLLNPKGEEITIHFFQGPTVLSPHITRTNHGLSLLNFQAVTEVEIGAFQEKALVELMIENQEVRQFANAVLRNELIAKVRKEIGLASMTAKERLLRFRQDFDGLENLAPHPMIASYLGITNISLSRLRRTLNK